MSTSCPFRFDETSSASTQIQTELQESNQNDISPLSPITERMESETSLINGYSDNTNNDRQELSANNGQYDISIDPDYHYQEANTMSFDHSKYICHNGELLPIDYILVYTRYHSNRDRRIHRVTIEHDKYRQFFQDRLRKLGLIVVEERLTDEENDLLNLCQAETPANVPDNKNSVENNHVLVGNCSTIQRHVTSRLQDMRSHLRRNSSENTDTNASSNDIIEDDPSIMSNDYDDDDDELQEISPLDETKQDERYFVKIHAPFEVLLVLAEKLKVKLPFSENKTPLKPALLDRAVSCQCARLNPDEFPEPHDGKSYFTACYQKSLHYRFEKYFRRVDEVFRPAERSRLVYEILLRCSYSSKQTLRTDSKFDLISSCLQTATNSLESNRSSIRHQQQEEKVAASEDPILEIEKMFTSSTRGSGMKHAGIEVLLEQGVYEAAYPLHDRLRSIEDAGEPETWNERTKLYHRWAKFSNIFRLQPIRAIRDYYGERLAFYFTWLGWYNSLLIVPSVLGIFVLLWGLLSVKYDRPTLDTCNSTSSYLMCPKIDQRSYWFLNETCFNAKMSYIFDNSASVLFAMIISVFAVLVNFLWQRKEIRFQFEWDITDIAEETETLRADFERRVPKTARHKVTGNIEPYVPTYKRFFYYTSSFSVVLLMVLLALAIVAGIIVYRLSISAAFSTIDRGMWIHGWKPIIVPITAALINLIIILILQYFYEKLAIWLTNTELHRTDSTYEASLTIKMFLFQFVNYYASIFYIALIKPLIIYKPTHLDRHSTVLRFEECDVNGCAWELSIQLIIIMVGKQTLSNIWEFYFSKLWNMCRKHIQFRDIVRQIKKRNAKMKSRHGQLSSATLKRSYEEDFLLQPFELTTLFYEYLEIILQFGFVTFFCLSFPLAPLFALINNIFEIRIDALKVIKEFRRPVARPAMGIGTWNSILSAMAKITVLSNAFIIAITSDYIPRQVYYWTLGNQSLNGFLHHTLAPFRPSDFPSIINRTLLECQFIESRLIDLSKQSTFMLPFAQSYHSSLFHCNSTLANAIRSQIDFSTCYYKDYRLDHTQNYAHSYMFYYVMVARLAFVIIFEHFVYGILFILQNVIRCVPRDVKFQLDRCRYLVQQMYWGAELYAEHPNLIKEDEKCVQDDEVDEKSPPNTFPKTQCLPGRFRRHKFTTRTSI